MRAAADETRQIHGFKHTRQSISPENRLDHLQATTIVARAGAKKAAKKAGSTIKKAGKQGAKAAKTTSGAEWYGPDRPGFLGECAS